MEQLLKVLGMTVMGGCVPLLIVFLTWLLTLGGFQLIMVMNSMLMIIIVGFFTLISFIMAIDMIMS